jgi:hypothetical protein
MNEINCKGYGRKWSWFNDVAIRALSWMESYHGNQASVMVAGALTDIWSKNCLHSSPAGRSISSVPPQWIEGAVTRYQVCRHNESRVPWQGIKCAATMNRGCRDKVSNVPPQLIEGAVTRYQVCRHNELRVPWQGIKCAARKNRGYRDKVSSVPPQWIEGTVTRYQVCRHKELRVPWQGIRCATTMIAGAVTRYQVCRQKESNVPWQGIRCAARKNRRRRDKVSGVPPE